MIHFKYSFFIAILCLYAATKTAAQSGVAIGTNSANPDPSALLDVSSNSQGILVPRMTATERQAINSPAEGLLVYQTDGSEGFWYFDGASWTMAIGPEGPQGATGPQGPAGTAAPGTTLGDMLYWNGSQWLLLPIGTPGSFLKVTAGGIPGWIGLPALTTTTVSSVTATTAVSGGTITSDNGEPVTSRGIVYSTSSNPTLLNTVVYSGSGTGSFTANMSGLSAGTTYYVRAFATNAVGTAYGNEISFSSAYTIGMNVLGGYVVYVDGSGIHGIVSASSDATDADWGCYGTSVSGTSTALGTGQASTNAIMTGCGTANIAARRCDALSSGGYTDWYLPSKDELTKVWEARWTYGISGLNVTANLYWSSSQFNGNGAWAQSFTSNVGLFESSDNKGNTKKVRCVRTF